MEASADGEKAKLAVPPHYQCPVSMELMVDPVMVATGHTYDRPFIQRWLEQGHKTCPVTGVRLRHLELIPNTDSQLIDPTERRAADTVERQRQLAPGLFGRK